MLHHSFCIFYVTIRYWKRSEKDCHPFCHTSKKKTYILYIVIGLNIFQYTGTVPIRGLHHLCK